MFILLRRKLGEYSTKQAVQKGSSSEKTKRFGDKDRLYQAVFV